jgi:hypothetical protein
MDIQDQADNVCDSLSPAVAPERLRSALERIAEAEHCLDLSATSWHPIGVDHWEQARRHLAQARSCVEGALAPWTV